MLKNSINLSSFIFFLQTNCISDKNTRNFSGFIIKCLCCRGNAVPGVRLGGAGEPRHPHHLPGHAAGGLQVTNQSPTSGHVTQYSHVIGCSMGLSAVAVPGIKTEARLGNSSSVIPRIEATEFQLSWFGKVMPSCHFMSCQVISCHIMICHIMSSCHVKSCASQLGDPGPAGGVLPRRIPGWPLWTPHHHPLVLRAGPPGLGQHRSLQL